MDAQYWTFLWSVRNAAGSNSESNVSENMLLESGKRVSCVTQTTLPFPLSSRSVSARAIILL